MRARECIIGLSVSMLTGSTMDAMSDAIEGADVMLYGVSLAYKESANVRVASRGVVQQLIGPSAFYRGCLAYCVSLLPLYQCRLEANYAHQQELDMIPLMMQKGYKPQGWRKSQHRVLRFFLQHRRRAIHM